MSRHIDLYNWYDLDNEKSDIDLYNWYNYKMTK